MHMLPAPTVTHPRVCEPVLRAPKPHRYHPLMWRRDGWLRRDACHALCEGSTRHARPEDAGLMRDDPVAVDHAWLTGPLREKLDDAWTGVKWRHSEASDVMCRAAGRQMCSRCSGDGGRTLSTRACRSRSGG